MLDQFLPVPASYLASQRQKRQSTLWLLWFGAVIGTALLLSLILISAGPDPAWIGWLLYLCGAALILYQPRVGLYLTVFLTLVGDSTLLPWYPFVKNFSSQESLLYLDDALIINPLETYLILLFISWWGRGAMQRKTAFFTGPLFWPAVVFMVFVGLGLVYGIGTGGNPNVALWEVRPIFYLFAMLVLSTNLLERREHANHLMWAAILALVVEGLVGLYHFFFTLNASLAGVDTITEHSAAIHMNTVFVFMLAAWMMKTSPGKKLVLPLAAAVLVIPYLAAQRRAAFITLALALVLLFLILYREKPRLFWLVAPLAAVAAIAYLVVFWNSGGALGLPAQAVKSIIAPEQASSADQSSNIYREIENINTGFTVHQKPLTGVGFGQKFYIIVPMADISFFTWWEYFPHNSIIWIWLKTGIGGFMAMLFMVGFSILLGAQAVNRVRHPDLRAIAATATLYLVMHFTYTYVDIAWDMQSMVYTGAVMGLISRIEYLDLLPSREGGALRWPWLYSGTSAH